MDDQPLHLNVADKRDQASRPASVAGSFALRALGCVICFEAASREALDLLDHCVFPSLSRELVPAKHADIHVCILEAEGQSQLVIDNVLIVSAVRPNELLRPLIDWLDRTLVQRLTGLFAVHAGAVLVGEQAVLLPGASHSGKSTLVAELLRRGAVCLSDEYALIDAEGRAHSYPRTLLLRNGGATQTPVAASDLNAQVASASAKVGWIFALRYAASALWSIQPTPQSSALLTLLQNTPHTLSDSPEMVRFFEPAVAGARCFDGFRGEASDAAERILALASA